MKKQQHFQQINTNCFHCGSECSKNAVSAQGQLFCCEGCKTVFDILQGNNLCNYYSLNNHPGLSQKASVNTHKFEYLDSKEVITKIIQFSSNNKIQVQFYLPQMHCSSCVWLLEQLHIVHSGIESTYVNFIKKEVVIAFDETKTSLRKVVETLASIGYEPHINLQDVSSKNSTPSNQKRILKIGVAGFCFSNIMMLSFPDYLAGTNHIEPLIQKGLQLISIILSLPVLLYAAQEFFVSAFIGLKNKYLNIDAPVALAIAITFCRSIYEIFTHQGNGYLDSMSGIVFFMLIGRWMQEKTYHSISFDRDYKSFFPIALQVINNNQITTTLLSEIKQNDVVIIHHNEVIPVDAIVSKGTCLIDYSFVTGEQTPVKKEIGELVYAGGKQLSGKIELLVAKSVSQSYLTTLWNNDAFKRKEKPSANVFDAVGKYFTYVVLVIGVIAGLYWMQQDDMSKMWNALTTVLIVACPCALLLSSNYANGNVLRIFGENNFYVRDASVLLQLQRLTHLVFDKTGTLTQSQESNIEYEGQKLNTQLLIEVASVLSQSNHPHSKAIVKFLDCTETFDVENFKEHLGLGIEAWINEQHLKIGSSKFINATSIDTNTTQVFIKVDNIILGKFIIKNVYRKNIFNLLSSLKKNYKVSIISGDNNTEATVLKNALGDERCLYFNQTPTDKLQYINNLQNNSKNVVAMIGDGLNDAGALKASNVGIAITDGVNNFTPACDAVLQASSINKINSFLMLSKTNNAIIFFTFFISAFYNFIGLSYAVKGVLSPVIAAVLMPTSSLTIIFFTFYLTKIMAKKYGLKT
jgi:P-type Cu+ transporter